MKPIFIRSSKAVPETVLQNPNCPTPDELARDMVMLRVSHYDFEGQIHRGHIVVHRLVADDVLAFFRLAFEIKFPIHRVIPINRFKWDDVASCNANNSSGFNMRQIAGTERLSKHAIGCAFDINPWQNPCYDLDPVTLALRDITPRRGRHIPGTRGTLIKGHPLVMLMQERGWTWGGDWTYPKDYHHFQKVPPELAHYVS